MQIRNQKLSNNSRLPSKPASLALDESILQSNTVYNMGLLHSFQFHRSTFFTFSYVPSFKRINESPCHRSKAYGSATSPSVRDFADCFCRDSATTILDAVPSLTTILDTDSINEDMCRNPRKVVHSFFPEALIPKRQNR